MLVHLHDERLNIALVVGLDLLLEQVVSHGFLGEALGGVREEFFDGFDCGYNFCLVPDGNDRTNVTVDVLFRQWLEEHANVTQVTFLGEGCASDDLEAVDFFVVGGDYWVFVGFLMALGGKQALLIGILIGFFRLEFSMGESFIAFGHFACEYQTHIKINYYYNE